MKIPARVLKNYNAGLSPKGNDHYNQLHHLGTIQMHSLFRATKAHKHGLRPGRITAHDVQSYTAAIGQTARERHGWT